MKRPIIIFSTTAIFVSIFLFYKTFAFPSTNTQEIGASFLPRVYITFIVLLGILLIVQEMKKQERTSYGGNLKFVLVSMVLVFIYIITIPIFGFFIATPSIVFLFLWLAKERKKITLVTVPVGITVFVFIFFEKLLSIQLPIGIFFS